MVGMRMPTSVVDRQAGCVQRMETRQCQCFHSASMALTVARDRS